MFPNMMPFAPINIAGNVGFTPSAHMNKYRQAGVSSASSYSAPDNFFGSASKVPQEVSDLVF
jgi:hypothetical protein